jgi:hypothetical protein
MLLMTVLFTLFAVAAVGVAVGVLALIEVLFHVGGARLAVPAQPRVSPVAFDLETLRRSAQAEMFSQSA